MIPDFPTFMFEPNFAGLVSFMVTVLLPILAALLMKRSWSTTTKGMVLLAVAAGKVLGESFLAQGDDFNLVNAVYVIAANYVIAVGFYFGLLKGSPLSERAMNTGIK